ncbi:mitogen-activated kinase 15 isoform X1 [Pelobates cultripes]|uniref:Mitogen-activated kinase 15 isoform X1 n=1 Tax=Pelobates cultripes TaxID=61616 RepID=A0AAD1S4R3_PELCU|nr:mitogen-activated kinase 15 isoform X1 [Pelobates cultripes]
MPTSSDMSQMMLERKVNTRKQKRQILKESVSSVPSNSVEPKNDQGKAGPTSTKAQTNPAGRNLEPTGSSVPQATTTTAVSKSDISQPNPKSRPPSYNPITHSVTNEDKRAVQETAGLPQHKKSVHQMNQEQSVASQPGMDSGEPHGNRKSTDLRGKTAPVARTRSFSLAQQARTAASNSSLTRKDLVPLGPVSVAAVSARLNQRTPVPQPRDNRSAQKFSRKMFQGTANVGAAGDPKASLQSYTQAYGTISKSALQGLPLQNSGHGGT